MQYIRSPLQIIEHVFFCYTVETTIVTPAFPLLARDSM